VRLVEVDHTETWLIAKAIRWRSGLVMVTWGDKTVLGGYHLLWLDASDVVRTLRARDRLAAGVAWAAVAPPPRVVTDTSNTANRDNRTINGAAAR
jgi:hypothetical protein